MENNKASGCPNLKVQVITEPLKFGLKMKATDVNIFYYSKL